MTTYLRDDPEPDYGTGCILGAFVAALLSLLFWAGIVWLLRWLMGVMR